MFPSSNESSVVFLSIAGQHLIVQRWSRMIYSRQLYDPECSRGLSFNLIVQRSRFKFGQRVSMVIRLSCHCVVVTCNFGQYLIVHRGGSYAIIKTIAPCGMLRGVSFKTDRATELFQIPTRSAC